MIITLLVLVLTCVVFLISLPYSVKLKRSLCAAYRITASIIVLGGSTISIFLTTFTIAQEKADAYIFQLLVTAVYILFSVFIIAMHWLSQQTRTAK